MLYDSDADDARLLADGDIGALLAKYGDVIVARCIAKLRGSLDAEDVAQNVKLRLLAEFHRGKRYGAVPYRVVVHQVIGWTVKDYFDGRPTDAPLPEGWEQATSDPYEAVDSRHHLTTLFDGLPERVRQVLEGRYLRGLERDEIAAELGIEPNAVDQALHRGHAKLREGLAHA